MLRRALFASSVLFASACDPRTPAQDIEYVVVDANGANPLVGRSLTTARAYFVQDYVGALEDSTETPIADGSFDLVVPIESFSIPIQVRLELASESGVELVGGTPSYYPSLSQTVGVIVGEPGTCDPVNGMTIGVARGSAGVNVNGTFVLVSGGVGTASRLDVDAIDLLLFRQYHLEDGEATLGATRSAAIDANASLVLPSESTPYVHRVYAQSGVATRPTVALHDGANTADAVVTLRSVGAVAIGGGADAAPSGSLSWVLTAPVSTEAYEVRTYPLHAAEPERSAVAAENGVWIVSRGIGATTLEQAASADAAPVLRLDAIADGVRRGGQLVSNAAGTDFLIFGGVDGADVVRTDTVAISGCPTACVAAPGPTWTNARTNIATDGSGYVAGGISAGALSNLVERVRFGATGFVIEPVAVLGTARRDAGFVRLPTGSIYLFGGFDAVGPRNDVEICFATP